MKKIYNSKWLFDFKVSLTLAFMLSFGAAFAQTQMSGTYTINRGATASATNFVSFQSCADSLATKGVSGSVTINVVANSGPYNEFVIFRAISGVSASRTVTINGNANTISHAGNTTNVATIMLQGADFMTISNLTINNTGTTNARNIQLRDGADKNTIINCNLTQPNMTGTGSGNCYVYVGNGAATSVYSYVQAGQDNIFRNLNCSAGINRGPYFGFCFMGPNNNSDSKFNTVDNCEIKDFWYMGVMTYYQDAGFVFTNNKVHNTGSLDQYGSLSMFIFISGFQGVVLCRK
jgi:trimeric autotransporter adhesin